MNVQNIIWITNSEVEFDHMVMKSEAIGHFPRKFSTNSLPFLSEMWGRVKLQRICPVIILNGGRVHNNAFSFAVLQLLSTEMTSHCLVLGEFRLWGVLASPSCRKSTLLHSAQGWQIVLPPPLVFTSPVFSPAPCPADLQCDSRIFPNEVQISIWVETTFLPLITWTVIVPWHFDCA